MPCGFNLTKWRLVYPDVMTMTLKSWKVYEKNFQNFLTFSNIFDPPRVSTCSLTADDAGYFSLEIYVCLLKFEQITKTSLKNLPATSLEYSNMLFLLYYCVSIVAIICSLYCRSVNLWKNWNFSWAHENDWKYNWKIYQEDLISKQ
jgi:hypothetical protein